jgi:hypothetical protein
MRWAVQTKETVKVKVNAAFRIVHQGVPYADGAVIEVPKDDTTDTWLKTKWIAPVLVSQKSKS